MALDRQGIERRDFPIGRRGYDPAAVDAHLREIAVAVEALQQPATAEGQPSRAVSAGLQVQGIIEAAERAQAEIEREAREKVQRTRDEALLDAARIREDAIAQARTLVSAVTQATSVLLERVGSMDGELATLVESLRAGATRLTGDLAAVKGNMGELYDAASVRTGSIGPGADAPPVSDAQAREITPPSVPDAGAGEPAPAAAAPAADPPPPAASVGPGSHPVAETSVRTITSAGPERAEGSEAPPHGMSASLSGPGPASATVAAPETVTTTAPQAKIWTTPVEEPAPAAPAAPPEADGDLDGARLIALNMALNGESRADAEKYLAEHFSQVDRAKLIDEVYAAIEA